MAADAADKVVDVADKTVDLINKVDDRMTGKLNEHWDAIKVGPQALVDPTSLANVAKSLHAGQVREVTLYVSLYGQKYLK